MNHIQGVVLSDSLIIKLRVPSARPLIQPVLTKLLLRSAEQLTSCLVLNTPTSKC